MNKVRVVMRVLWVLVAVVQMLPVAVVWRSYRLFSDLDWDVLVQITFLFFVFSVLAFLFVFAIERALKKED